MKLEPIQSHRSKRFEYLYRLARYLQKIESIEPEPTPSGTNPLEAMDQLTRSQREDLIEHCKNALENAKNFRIDELKDLCDYVHDQISSHVSV